MPREVTRNDPFLTSGGVGARNLPEFKEDARADPFLTEHAARYGATEDLREDVRADPFLTEHATRYRATKDLREGAVPAGFAETFSKLRDLLPFLPPGYDGRTELGLKQLVIHPFVAFAGMLLTWSILQHVNLQLCVVVTFLWGCVCIGTIVRSTKHLLVIRVSPKVLGTLVLLGLAWGFAVGLQGYSLHFRQIWFSFSGPQLSASAATPGDAVSDAATVDFYLETSSQSATNGTSVDSSRSAGFKDDGHIYCVAPVMNAQTASADLPRVNYWAIGVDCCQPFGSFTCGDSREPEAGYGVVMLDGGFPCPTCNNDQFRLAVGKAESLFGVASAPGAVSLQWTKSVSGVKYGMMVAALIFLAVSLVLAIFSFAVLGGIVWFFGLGLSDDEKLGRERGSVNLKSDLKYEY